MSIIQHISNLLYIHDCVIVPGFGGFVSNYQPAQVHPIQHSFNPPSKRILFNSELKSNDGLLANELMSETTISYQDAMRKIDVMTSQWKSDLKVGKSIELEKIGKLFADKEGNIQFEQDTAINFLEDSFGMTTFVSPAIRRSYKGTRPQPRPVISQSIKSGTDRMSLNFVRIAAAVAVLAMLTFVGINIFTGPQHWASETSVLSSFNNILESPIPTNIPTSDNDFENANVVESDPTISSTNETEISTEDIKEPKAALPEKEMPTLATEPATAKENLNTPLEVPSQLAPAPKPEPQPAQRMYHLIAGSFNKASNAESLIESYQSMGYQTALIGPAANGFYRVSIMACLRKDDALAELRKVRDAINPNIWLLRQ